MITKRSLRKRAHPIIMLANSLGDSGREVLARHAVALIGTYPSNKQMSFELDNLEVDLAMVCIINPRVYGKK